MGRGPLLLGHLHRRAGHRGPLVVVTHGAVPLADGRGDVVGAGVGLDLRELRGGEAADDALVVAHPRHLARRRFVRGFVVRIRLRLRAVLWPPLGLPVRRVRLARRRGRGRRRGWTLVLLAHGDAAAAVPGGRRRHRRFQISQVGRGRRAAGLDEVHGGAVYDVPVRLDVREYGLVVLAASRAAGPRADGLAQRGDPPRVAELVNLNLDELGGFVILSLHRRALASLELANLGADSLEAVDAVAEALGLVVVLPRDGFIFERVNLSNLNRGDGIDVEVDGHVGHARAPGGPGPRREVPAGAAPPGVRRGDGLADDVDGDDAHLVVDVELVDVTLVDDDAEDGGVDVDVHGLELPGLVPARGVRIEA